MTHGPEHHDHRSAAPTPRSALSRCPATSACQAIRLSEYPPEHRAAFGSDCPEDGFVMHGSSMIVSPLGEVLAGPVYESEVEIYADLDLSQLEKGNLDFDPCGDYSRPDMFQLKVNTAPLRAVNFSDE
ncbi:nitrilase-related carbon-nitrogen hydrolase [Pseudomonas aeruginosa]|uniref:nitrilase-related carbon-nitrogen hydrolase n=1 Tax=Pseudomonas aeruginosa TaxID=287 RepID=UPI003FD4989B